MSRNLVGRAKGTGWAIHMAIHMMMGEGPSASAIGLIGLVLALGACSSSGGGGGTDAAIDQKVDQKVDLAPDKTPGTGGATGSGGTTGSGGAASATDSGADTVDEGTDTAGGTTGTGGAPGTGGVSGVGGVTGNGTGGDFGTGGAVGTGGVIGTGGVTGTGGVIGAGGIIGTGGVVGTGGDTGIDGGADSAVGTGGAGTGGDIGTGGAGTGGIGGTGGALGTGGTGTSDAGTGTDGGPMNLITDPSVEGTPPGPWLRIGGCGTYAQSSILAHTGTHSAGVTGRSALSCGVANGSMPLVDGSYTLSLWAHFEPGTTGLTTVPFRVTARVDCVNPASQKFVTIVNSVNSDMTNPWTLLSGPLVVQTTVNAAANVAACSTVGQTLSHIYLYLEQPTGTLFPDFYVDDVDVH
jgi:hypothetical protein